MYAFTADSVGAERAESEFSYCHALPH